MFKNYITIALRNFRRNKLFSLINVLGLAIGISASLVIYLIVQYEFSFDKFWKDKERIYRVTSNMHFPDQDFKNSGVPGPLPIAVRNEVPGIGSSTVFWALGNFGNKVTIQSGIEKKVFKQQKNMVYADNHYFNVFPYKWIAGSPSTALKQPGQVVLTSSRAKSYFPSGDLSNAIGKTIIYDDSVKAVVSGIVENIQEITDFTFQEFVSLSTFEQFLKNSRGYGEWGSISSSSQFFIKLKPGIKPHGIRTAINAVRTKHSEKNDYLKTDHALQPLNDIHFNHDFDNFDQRQAHTPTLYGLLAVAGFLLLLGCINFINLTTAQASQRSKEIGVRKTMGSSRSHLIFQFLSETIVLTLTATAISILMTPWILKIFSDYIPDGLDFQLLKPHIIIFISLLVLIVGILSGIYPALVLSRFKPVLVLKNVAYANTSRSRTAWIRKTLTVSQFVIAQFFIIATMIVGKQIRFTLNQELGFRKEAIINFSAPFTKGVESNNSRQVLYAKLKSIPEIEDLSLAGSPPASSSLSMQTMKFRKDGKDLETTVEIKHADTSYLSLYNMKLLAGRNLQQSDTVREYLVNEAYLKFLGYKNPAEILGKYMEHGPSPIPVVGVIADVNSKSLHQAIQPLAYTSSATRHFTFHVALRPEQANTDAWRKAITKIEKAWKEVYPEEEFNYSFFDESIAKFYKKEQDIARLLNWCTGLSIFISCLGLLGLVIYTTSQRTKEIGVRKVLGASVSQIVALISKDFMQLVILAFIIAAPLSWWAMLNWLQNFAYRTGISWWIFVAAGISMLLLALVVLSLQTIRSAMVNPVKSLRTE